MQSAWIEREADPVVNLGLDARLDRGHHRVRSRLDVEEDLRTEFLDDLDRRIEAEVRRIAAGRDAKVLRADSERDVLSNMRAELAGDHVRQLDADVLVVGPKGAVGVG